MSEVLDEDPLAGPLGTVLKDTTIHDIPSWSRQTYARRRGKMEKTNVVFADDDHLMQIVNRVISKVGPRMDETR